MTTSIVEQLDKSFLHKWIKVHEYLDKYNDVVYSLDVPKCKSVIVMKQILEIYPSYSAFDIIFHESGSIECVTFYRTIELFDTNLDEIPNH